MAERDVWRGVAPDARLKAVTTDGRLPFVFEANGSRLLRWTLSRVVVWWRGVRSSSVVGGCLWGMRTEVVGEVAYCLVRGLSPMDCKSIAKASKVRILHLPPRAERAPDQRKRRSGALSCGPAVIGSNRLSTAARREYAGKLRPRPALRQPRSAPRPPRCALSRLHLGHRRTWRRP